MQQTVGIVIVVITVLCVQTRGCMFQGLAHDHAGVGPDTNPLLNPLLTSAKSRQSSEILHMLGAHHNGNLSVQYIPNHYCNMIEEESSLIQCALLQTDDKGRQILTGIEYIVNEETFKNFSSDEKALWHSHQYEAKSGQLLIEGLNATHTQQMLAMVANTYGKIWNTWPAGSRFPLGVPEVHFSFTGHGQMDKKLLDFLDKLTNTTTAERSQKTAHLQYRTPAEGADSWMNGTMPILTIQKQAVPKNVTATV